VKLFRAHHGFVIACVYGADSDWVRNILAAGRFELVHLGRVMSVESADIVHDHGRQLVPWILRPVFRLLRVVDFVPVNRERPR
jgi:hypothetical protein